jgi:hypothetical protein
VAKPVKLVVAEIGRRLATAAAPGSPNQMSPAELRDLAIEYLAEKDEEQVAIPHIAGLSHWNLWFVDARLEDTLFAVLVFWPDRLEFVCGTGYGIELRGWDSDDPANPACLAAELRAAFRVPEPPLTIDRRAAEAWLGRSW